MIRRMQEADRDRVAEIWLDTNLKAHSFIRPEYWKGNFEYVKETLLQAEVYVCEEKGRIQGFAGINGGHIEGIFVSEEAQARGIGKELMDFIKGKKNRLSLHVYLKNTGAVRFYQREGFEILNQGMDENTKEAELFMGWKSSEREETTLPLCLEGDDKMIRQETAGDYKEVYELIKEAFASAEHCDGNEQDLAAALRKGESFLPELSLVAEIEGKIVGHILFTKAKVGEEEALALAPLSVKPGWQGKGIGKALILEGHRIARRLGYHYSLVLGSSEYYPKTGYRPAEQFHIEAPEGIPSDCFMAAPLQENPKPVSGKVTYAKEFGI